VVVRSYAVNFYGTDYGKDAAEHVGGLPGMDSDRLFASWELNSSRVQALSERREVSVGKPDDVIEISNDFGALVKSDPAAAKVEALRIRKEFLRAFAAGLVCRAFERDEQRPRYLLYKEG
jgi:predicted GNAT superfamily acetyltransferase